MKYIKLLIPAVIAASFANPWGLSTVEGAGQDGKASHAAIEAQLLHVYENEGCKLRIPKAYSGLLQVDVLSKEDGKLFKVSEKASIEAAQKENHGDIGAGWLFTIGKVSESRLHEMLCQDMSGVRLFARDAAGNYYMEYHPTDVRYVRETPKAMKRDAKQWSKLNEWSRSFIEQDFIKDNPGLVPMTADNSDMSICVANAIYRQDSGYSLSAFGNESVPGTGFSAKPYGEKLIYGMTYQNIDSSKTPRGEYIRLSIPGNNTVIDFFTGEGCENLVREVWDDGTARLYEARHQDKNIKAGEVIKEWMEALKVNREMGQLGYTADSLKGTWIEKIAGRGNITIEDGAEDGNYNVSVYWGSSASEAYVWNMTAQPIDNNTIGYSDCRHSIITFYEDGTESEELKYENGTGTFTLNSANEIMWQDDVDGAGADTVFVSNF